MGNVVNSLAAELLSSPLILFFVVLGIISLIWGNKIVGKAGEHWAKRELNRLDSDYKIINDLMVRTQDGRTHQIDHVVVSMYGIFVIETKQWNGYIVGNEYDKKWTIFGGNQKYYTENPIRQNYGHVKALQEVLNINKNKLISMVYIPSRAKVKVKSNKVVRARELKSKILSYENIIIDNPNEIYNTLLNQNITERSERKEHTKYAKNIKNTRKINDPTKCPWCGGRLIERAGKYGNFIGCSNYPRCKFTKKI